MLSKYLFAREKRICFSFEVKQLEFVYVNKKIEVEDVMEQSIKYNKNNLCSNQIYRRNANFYPRYASSRNCIRRMGLYV